MYNNIKQFLMRSFRVLGIRLTLFCLSFLGTIDGYAQFRASVVKVDVTPNSPQYLAGYGARQSNGIHDHIFLRIVAMDDGKDQFFVISSDFGKYDISLYDEVVTKLYEKLQIPLNHVWWCVTHTHSAPEIGLPGLSEIFMPERYKQAVAMGYTNFVVEKLINGVKEARLNLEPAKLGVGWGFSNANINRRAIDENGKASLGLNPDLPVDRRIGLLRIDRLDGGPIALIANYQMHGTVLGPQSLEISGDAPGIVSEYVERKIGAPMLYMNGAAGDMAPIYSVYPNPRAGHLDQFKVLLGDKIIEAYKRIDIETSEVKLKIASIIVETPRKAGLTWPKYLSKYSRKSTDGGNLIRIPVRFLAINEDIAIWSAPLELFCEVAMEVRRKSPFPYTFYFGYANGNLRYLPTRSAWINGGYEPAASPFTESGAEDLSRSVLSYLQSELRSK